ncbi:MAG: MG2 domain-containing protein, partial [Nannocystaceae bacterium]
MQSWKGAMLQRRSAIALLVAQSLACQPTPGGHSAGETTAAPDSPFRAAAEGGEGLVFPPAPRVQARRALPRHLAEDEHTGQTPTQVDWPQLDDEGKFEIEGQTLRIHFNRSIVPPAEGVQALSIEPAVDGETSWPSPWTLAFRAAAPFDPDTEHTVTLGELVDEDGATVSEGWTGVFTAQPRISIGGKVIAYIPEPGKPRMVAVRPDAPPRVAPQIAPTVLFDQPVALALAAARLRAEVDGVPRRLELQHPTEGVFEGVPVDREHLVIARPAKPLAPGQTLRLTVLDAAGAVLETHEYEVAEHLRFTGVECNEYGYGYEEHECTWKDGTLAMEGNRFMVRFNNPIPDTKDLAKRIKVSPRVDNLRVHTDTWRSDGAVWVSGEFSSSTRYTVKVRRLEDRYGSRLGSPLHFTVDTKPMSASVSMPEGQQVLDEAGSVAFPITTRNVEQARLELWEVEPRAQAWAEARRRLGSRERPSGEPDIKIDVRPKARRDASVTTTVDLLDHLEAGKTYVARLQLTTPAFGATPPSYPSWAMAARPPTSLVTPHDANALAVHVHAGRDEALVHVATLGDGHPVAGARLLVDGERVPGIKTDASGMAVIERSLGAGTHVVEVESARGSAVLALGGGTLDERDLAPELTAGAEVLDDIRALALSDRGVYRPGATVQLKGIVQFRRDGRLRPASTMPVGLRIYAPTGKQVFSDDEVTSELGSIVSRFEVPENAEIGRYRVELVAPLRDDAVLASYGVQIAEFEPPRFTVDVEAHRAAAAGPTSAGASDRLEASVHGRYLFGAAMEDAAVSWTLRRGAAALPAGPLPSKGFVFRRVRSWWDDEPDDAWVRSGEGTLDGKGRLSLQPMVELAADEGPQRFVLEAEVTDESHRSITGRTSVVLHPAERYAGLKLADRWLDVGKAIPVEAGVVDPEGATVGGVGVELRLERLEWKRARRPGPGGSADERWHEVAEEVGRCTTSGAGTAGCTLVPRTSGSYRVSAWLDGRRGGTQRLWAWGRGGASPLPSPGRRLEIVADKASYAPGDTATLMVSNPYPAATALLTVEQGGILHHETRTLTESAARFTVELGAEHAPHAHATITLLPRDAEGEARVDWKLGAIRLPVQLSDNRLDVTVASDRDRYEPGEAVDIVVDVSAGGTAVAGAEVALAVVDEGVLRLTNFHAPDPVSALYPGQGLELTVDDSRRLLAERLRRSHVAGDGSGAGSHSLVSTRKDFVRTALWKPQLRTDADGRAHVRFTLPDNLTRFRMMAVVIDDQGRGGVHEDDFEVQMPLMAIPAVPRFAAISDRFEAAVLVHNNQDHPERTTVKLGKRVQQVEIAAGGRARVAFEMKPERAGTMTLRFSIADATGAVRDRVEAKLPVQAPGIDERPYLHGSFVGRQEVSLEIPAEVIASAQDDHVTVTVGENLWPELGARVEYLVGYPHGCVEQTTSSTLP